VTFYYTKHCSLGLVSVVGSVIQATGTGRSEFEDGLRSGDFMSGYSYQMSVRTGFPDLTTHQCRPNSKSMLKHLLPLFEYRS
jgi:hypothetical protein